MSNLWTFIKQKYLTKEFLTFVIIGFINTAINYLVVWVTRKFGMYLVFSTALAFIIASIFSYFANSRFSFHNNHYSWKKGIETMGILTVRLGLTELLTFLFVWILSFTNISDFVTSYTSDAIANLCASVLMIPFAYLFLEKILKVKETEVLEDEANID